MLGLDPTRNLVLIGPRCSGKTTLAPLLAEALQRPWVDLDVELARRAGRPADAVLAQDGEAAFRKRERDVLRWAAGLSGHVIATGGGAVLHAVELARLAEQACVLSLDLPLELLVARATARPRPALTALPMAEEMAEIVRLRRPLYRSYAHLTVEHDAPGPILELIRSWSAATPG